MSDTVRQMGDWLRLSAQRYPDRVCWTDADGGEFSYAEANARVDRLAHALMDRGVSKGDRVALLGVDSIPYLESLFALMKLGAVFAPLNYRLSAREVETLLSRVEAKAIFADDQYLKAATEWRDRIDGLSTVLSFGEGGSGASSYSSLVSGPPVDDPSASISDEDILGIGFTSGTTSLPKMAMQPQRMFKSLSQTIAVAYQTRAHERYYSGGPMFHIAGMSLHFAAIARGCSTLIMPSFSPSTTLRALREERLTGCFLVPTMISWLLREPGVGDSDYPDLRMIMYGGSPMPPALLQRALKTFSCGFVNGFGAGTEAGLQTDLDPAAHRRAIDGENHLLSSIGKPAFGVELRLVDEGWEDVRRGEIGMIATKSESTMLGYLGMADRTSECMADGWFRSGDLAWMDEEGFLYLAGRKNDLIIRGGENIYPIEIEEVLQGHERISDVAVIGVPDEHWGEVVKAFIVTEDAHDISEGELSAYCREFLAGYKVPDRYERVTELPRNATGKVLKRVLRDGSIEL